MMETAQDIHGMLKGPGIHKERWWWNEGIADAVGEKHKVHNLSTIAEQVAMFRGVARNFIWGV